MFVNTTPEFREQLQEMILKILEKVSLCRGEFNAKNGSIEFMYGIEYAMEIFANEVSTEFAENLEELIYENMQKSIDKAFQA